MNIYESDQEQLEAIKKWWKENGAFTIAAVVLALLISFGWRYWQQYKTQKAEEASILYEQMLVNLDKQQTADFSRIATELEQHYTHTPYASNAALFEAQQAIKANNFKLAEQKLQWAMEHATGPTQKQIARLRAARVLLAMQKNQEAMKLLDKIDDKAYLPAINLIKGDIYAAQQQTKQAHQAYADALTELPASSAMRPLVEMKLAQFAVAQ